MGQGKWAEAKEAIDNSRRYTKSEQTLYRQVFWDNIIKQHLEKEEWTDAHDLLEKMVNAKSSVLEKTGYDWAFDWKHRDWKLPSSFEANTEDFAKLCVRFSRWEEAAKWQEQVVQRRDEQYGTSHDSKESVEHLERLALAYKNTGQWVKRDKVNSRLLRSEFSR